MVVDKEVAKEKEMIPPVGNCCHSDEVGRVLLLSADSTSCVAVSLRTGAARQLSSSSRAERTKLC